MIIPISLYAAFPSSSLAFTPRSTIPLPPSSVPSLPSPPPYSAQPLPPLYHNLTTPIPTQATLRHQGISMMSHSYKPASPLPEYSNTPDKSFKKAKLYPQKHLSTLNQALPKQHNVKTNDELVTIYHAHDLTFHSRESCKMYIRTFLAFSDHQQPSPLARLFQSYLSGRRISS